jgi:peptidyl-prolyl cis-trans isomerase B (cyclophilin B)
MHLSLTGLVLLAAAVTTAATSKPAATGKHVTLDTSKGKIVLELYPEKAPKSVANFIHYVNNGHYDNTMFHRVIAGFMIQGGGFDATGKERATDAPVQNEADNGLLNDKYYVAMARTGDPQSATAQFFINVVNNSFLNFTAKTPQGWGYTVFAKVVQGMDIVDAMAKVAVKSGPYSEAVPVEPILLKKATVTP